MRLSLLGITVCTALQLTNILLQEGDTFNYILLVVFYTNTAVHLLITGLTDPGIIPRNMDGLSIDVDLLDVPSSSYKFKPTLVTSDNDL